MATKRRRRGTVKRPANGNEPLDYMALVEMQEKARRARRVYEGDWLENIAFIAGEQFVQWNVDTGNIVEMQLPDPDRQPFRNFMLKISRTERAKILKTVPSPTALPVSDGGDDEMRARVMNAWFSHLQDVWKYERRLRTAVYWVVATGNCFLKWFFADGMPQMKVVNPFDMYVDPYAETMLDARWMIHAQFMPLDRAKEIYGKQGDVSFLSESSPGPRSNIESRLLTNFGYGDGVVADLPGVIVNEYYQPPTAADPAGRYIVFAHNGTIYDSDFPYEHGHMPFTHLGHIERANSKYYASIMDAVRPLQIEANRAESRVIQNVNVSQGKWFIPMELELDQEPDASPRQILHQIGGPIGVSPELITPNSLPQWVVDEPARIQMTAEDIAGQHEVSNAGVPGRVEAAQAIQLLQEADDSLIKDSVHSMEEAVAEGYWQTAANTKQYGSAKILIQAYDKSGRVEVEELLTDEIDMSFRVKVQTTTALPQTISGKWDRVMTLYQNQIIDAVTALRLLGLTTDHPDLNNDQVDRNNQYRYNKKMAKGEIVRPQLWENHEAMLDEMNKFRKTAEYANLSEETKKKFDFHEDERKKQRLAVAQEEAQLLAVVQAAAGGGEGGGGGAPAPAPQPGPSVVP